MMHAETQEQFYSVTQVINKHIELLQRETGVSMNTFALNVREHYESTNIIHSRIIEWSQTGDIYSRIIRDAQKLNRWLDRNSAKPLSIDLIDSIVHAFPPDRRFRLQTELAARQGMIVVPMPSNTLSEDGISLGKIAKETGEAIIAISQLLDDDVIDIRDKNKANSVLTELDEAIAVLVAMKTSIKVKALGN